MTSVDIRVSKTKFSHYFTKNSSSFFLNLGILDKEVMSAGRDSRSLDLGKEL